MQDSARLLLLMPFFAFSASAQSYTISTFAGGTVPPATAPALSAAFGSPQSIAVDHAGNVYIAAENCIFKLEPSGDVTRIAGNGRPGLSGDGGPASQAQLNFPRGLAADSSGNLYIGDPVSGHIRVISTTGIISTFEVSGGAIYPWALTVDASGNLYVADYVSSSVVRVSPTGNVLTIAGTGTPGYSGDNGPAANAQISFPQAVAIDSSGNLYIADTGNNRIRRVSSTGTITTVAGNGSQGYTGDNGAATAAELSGPSGLAFDASGNLYIGDTYNLAVRKVTPSGTITTAAGGLPNTANFDAIGEPASLAFLPDGTLLALDIDGNRIMQLDSGGHVSVYATNAPITSSMFAGAATGVLLASPTGVAVDAKSNVYIADNARNIILKVDPSQDISLFAGTGTFGFSGDGGPATSAQLAGPNGLAVDSSGNLYVADAFNNRVRKVTPSGTISTVVGNGTYGFSGDGGPATSAELSTPSAVALDSQNNLYIIDGGNNRVRKVSSSGTISTFAGNGGFGSSGDGGPATAAELGGPTSVSVDSSGNVYIADYSNLRIRKVTPSGVISTFFIGQPLSGILPYGLAVDQSGNVDVATQVDSTVGRISPAGDYSALAGNGIAGYSGDGGPATSAELASPAAIAINLANGYVYVADSGDGAIRLLTPNPSGCSYSLSTTYAVVPASGGAVSVSVTTAAGCAWPTLTLPSWITSSAPATGPGTLILTVAANTGAARTDQVSIAGVLLTVTQQGAGAVFSAVNAAVNAANYSTSVAPGSLASAFGAFPFANPAGASSVPIPTVLAGLSLQFTGAPLSPLFYANGTQVNLQIPWELTGKTQATLTPTVNGQAGQSFAVNLVTYGPGIFSVNSSGTGQGAILDQNYHLVDSTHPAVPGVTVLQIFCTGLGPVTNQPATGAASPSNPPATTTTIPTVTIGAASAHVEFSGLAPGFVGLYQVNALVPSAAPAGNSVPVSLSIGGATSNTVTIAVQ